MIFCQRWQELLLFLFMKEPILLNYENGVSNSMVCYDLYLIPQWASPFSRADNATCSLLNA